MRFIEDILNYKDKLPNYSIAILCDRFKMNKEAFDRDYEVIKNNNKKLVITSRTEASEFESLDSFPKYEDRHVRIDENGIQDLNDLWDESPYEKALKKWVESNTPIKTYKVVKFSYPYFGKQEKILTDDPILEKNQCSHPFRIGAILDCKVDNELMICEILE